MHSLSGGSAQDSKSDKTNNSSGSSDSHFEMIYSQDQQSDDSNLNLDDSILAPQNMNKTPAKLSKSIPEAKAASTPRPSHVPKISVPEFDTATRTALEQGNSHRAWSAVVDTLASNFINNAENTERSQSSYLEVGKLVITRYPCLKREGSKPWVRNNTNFYRK